MSEETRVEVETKEWLNLATIGLICVIALVLLSACVLVLLPRLGLLEVGFSNSSVPAVVIENNHDIDLACGGNPCGQEEVVRETNPPDVEETDDDFFELKWLADARWRSHRPGYQHHTGLAARMVQPPNYQTT